jgi:hypothetical protein
MIFNDLGSKLSKTMKEDSKPLLVLVTASLSDNKNNHNDDALDSKTEEENGQKTRYYYHRIAIKILNFILITLFLAALISGIVLLALNINASVRSSIKPRSSQDCATGNGLENKIDNSHAETAVGELKVVIENARHDLKQRLQNEIENELTRHRLKLNHGRVIKKSDYAVERILAFEVVASDEDQDFAYYVGDDELMVVDNVDDQSLHNSKFTKIRLNANADFDNERENYTDLVRAAVQDFVVSLIDRDHDRNQLVYWFDYYGKGDESALSSFSGYFSRS